MRNGIAGILICFVLSTLLLGCNGVHVNVTINKPVENGEGKTGVDYSDKDNWAYYAIGEDKDADLFLICPTVDMNDEYNMSMDDEKTKENFLGALNMVLFRDRNDVARCKASSHYSLWRISAHA